MGCVGAIALVDCTPFSPPPPFQNYSSLVSETISCFVGNCALYGLTFRDFHHLPERFC